MAIQQVPAATALTGQLIFLDSDGKPVTGPVGNVTSSEPAVSPSLSADGQYVNFTSLPGEGSVTLTWFDPTGAVSNFSADFRSVAEPPVNVVSGSFGPVSPGTTA